MLDEYQMFIIGLVAREKVPTFDELVGYFNSDWARNPNGIKLILGYSFNLGSGIVGWSSKKQPTVYFSSIEAQYKSLCSDTCGEIWLRRILEDVGVDKSPTINMCDDQITIKLDNNIVYHTRSKHIKTHHHFVREKMQSKEIELVYCNTNENVAKILRKPLGNTKFEVCRNQLGAVENTFLH